MRRGAGVISTILVTCWRLAGGGVLSPSCQAHRFALSPLSTAPGFTCPSQSRPMKALCAIPHTGGVLTYSSTNHHTNHQPPHANCDRQRDRQAGTRAVDTYLCLCGISLMMRLSVLLYFSLLLAFSTTSIAHECIPGRGHIRERGENKKNERYSFTKPCFQLRVVDPASYLSRSVVHLY